jgi:hypothetical protein
MLQGYFDDSGSDGTCEPFVLAGYILPSTGWKDFSNDWKTILRRQPSIEYFKMSEAAIGRGEFSRIQLEFRRHKIRSLIELVGRHQLHGVCSCLNWTDWRHFNCALTGPAKDQPFSPLFFLLIDTILAYQKNLVLFPKEIQLDFDQQGSAGNFAIEWYQRMIEGVGPFRFTEQHRQILHGTPRMFDERECVPLQAADMLAWAIRSKLDERKVSREFDETWRSIAKELPQPNLTPQS